MRKQIRPNRSIDRFRADLLQRIVIADAGVVDEYRDTAEPFEDLGERALHLIELGHVGLDEQCGAAVVIDVVHQVVAVRFVDVQNDHSGAQPTELDRQLSAQTLGASCGIERGAFSF